MQLSEMKDRSYLPSIHSSRMKASLKTTSKKLTCCNLLLCFDFPSFTCTDPCVCVFWDMKIFKCIYLCIHRHSQDMKQCHYGIGVSFCPVLPFSPEHWASALTTADLFFISACSFISRMLCYKTGVMWYVIFWYWLLWVSIIPGDSSRL